jgi:hypothetical protein
MAVADSQPPEVWLVDSTVLGSLGSVWSMRNSLPGAWAPVEVRFEVAHDTSSNHAVRFDLLQLEGPIFADGFESGDAGAWSAQVPQGQGDRPSRSVAPPAVRSPIPDPSP